MNTFKDLFEQQKRHFSTGVTRSYEWRIEQLDRMARLLDENESALQQAVAKDFKTASQEQVFETLACRGEVEFQKSQLKNWMAPIEVPVPKALAATGHRGVIYRDPYGVALIIGPFNGPLLLLLRPAIAALDHREEKIGISVALRRMEHIMDAAHGGCDAHRADMRRSLICPDRELHLGHQSCSPHQRPGE